MDFTGKNVKVHLATPLTPIKGFGAVGVVKGKVLEKFEDGVLIQVESIEPKQDSKYTYATVFIPTHKIDFIGVLE